MVRFIALLSQGMGHSFRFLCRRPFIAGREGDARHSCHDCRGHDCNDVHTTIACSVARCKRHVDFSRHLLPLSVTRLTVRPILP